MKTILLSSLLLIFASCSRRDMNVSPDPAAPLARDQGTYEAEGQADPCANPGNLVDRVGYAHNLLLRDCAPLIKNGTLSSDQAIQERINATAHAFFGVTTSFSKEVADWLQRQAASGFVHATEECPEPTRPYLMKLTATIEQAMRGEVSYQGLKQSIEQIEAAAATDNSLSAENRLMILVGTSIGRYTSHFWMNERDHPDEPSERRLTPRDYVDATKVDIWAGVITIRNGGGPVKAYVVASERSANFLWHLQIIPD